jgi:hypothetical protein
MVDGLWQERAVVGYRLRLSAIGYRELKKNTEVNARRRTVDGKGSKRTDLSALGYRLSGAEEKSRSKYPTAESR